MPTKTVLLSNVIIAIALGMRTFVSGISAKVLLCNKHLRNCWGLWIYSKANDRGSFRRCDGDVFCLRTNWFWQNTHNGRWIQREKSKLPDGYLCIVIRRGGFSNSTVKCYWETPPLGGGWRFWVAFGFEIPKSVFINSKDILNSDLKSHFLKFTPTRYVFVIFLSAESPVCGPDIPS